MGNHAVGRAFNAAIEAMAARRRPEDTALGMLDEAAELTDIRGADAEFDDEPFEDGPFRALLIEAFGGEGFVDDEDGEAFYERCYTPFSERYDLC